VSRPRPTRVIIATESNQVWGAEESLLRILRHADSNNVEATVLASLASPLTRRCSEISVPVLEHQFVGGRISRPGISAIARAGSSFWRLCNHFRRCDVVIAFSAWQALEVAAAARLARRPVLFDLHETFSTDRSKMFIRVIDALCTGVLAPSEHVLVRGGLTPGRRRLVVPRPVSLRQFDIEESRKATRYGRGRSSHFTIGIFGQIVPHKGTLEVLTAIEKIQHLEPRLLIVGGTGVAARTKYEHAVRRRATEARIDVAVVDRVHDPSDLMRQCDVVVNASEHEAFGRTVLESIAAGTWPVVIAGTGPTEIVGSVGVGSIASSRNELAGILETLAVEGVPLVDLAQVRIGLEKYSGPVAAKHYFDAVRKIGRLAPSEELGGATGQGAR
jgi:glycosyltransferase involved in cell wall biosynthesis